MLLFLILYINLHYLVLFVYFFYIFVSLLEYPEGGIDLIARFTTTDGQNIRLSWCLPPNADPYYHANLYECVTSNGSFMNRIGEADGATEEELCDALELSGKCQAQEVKF